MVAGDERIEAFGSDGEAAQIPEVKNAAAAAVIGSIRR